jgi:hypothetical protein
MTESSNSLSATQEDIVKKPRAGDVTQWDSCCILYARSWVSFPEQQRHM